jgi:hypothetical protein
LSFLFFCDFFFQSSSQLLTVASFNMDGGFVVALFGFPLHIPSIPFRPFAENLSSSPFFPLSAQSSSLLFFSLFGVLGDWGIWCSFRCFGQSKWAK